jgi:hypothetical protein
MSDDTDDIEADDALEDIADFDDDDKASLRDDIEQLLKRKRLKGDLATLFAPRPKPTPRPAPAAVPTPKPAVTPPRPEPKPAAPRRVPGRI